MVMNLSHCTSIETTVLLRTFNVLEVVSYPYPDLTFVVNCIIPDFK